ncbi:MAG: MCE family protein [Helicobacteraceae bacterium]|nr:MCE family protein [Helicobacteraceae bacterium]
MERGVNYILIGLCFIATLIGLVVFIFWFGGNNEFGSNVKKYKAYSKVAIDGVSPDSSIKYKGINVGKIVDINFKDNNFDEIEFDLIIREDLPIKKDSVLKVDQSGILGSNFLNLIQNDSSNDMLDVDGVLQIKSGGMSQILESAPSLTGKIDSLLQNTNEIISPENVKNITSILESIKDSAIKLNKMMSLVQEKTKEIGSLIANVNDVSNTTNTMLKTINQKINDGEYDIKDILTPSLISIENSMNNINKLAEDGSILLKDLRENPYNTIFGYREK